MDNKLITLISIVLATRNRSDKLRNALNSMREMYIPELMSLEIIIVDNLSTDNTRYVSELFIESSNMNVRYVFEEKKGLSYARNSGIREAKGEIIVFIDDDVIVDRKWMVEIFKIVNSGKEYGMIFGQTRIYSPDLCRLSTKEVDHEETFEMPCSPWAVGNGNNMLIKRSTLNKVGYFDISLGAGTKVGSAEDTDYVHRVLRSGMKIIYSPDLIVYHDHGRILPEEIKRIRYNYAKGRGAFYCKYILRNDMWAFKLFMREVRRLFRGVKNRRNYRVLMLNMKGLMYGFMIRIIEETKRITTGDRRPGQKDSQGKPLSASSQL